MTVAVHYASFVCYPCGNVGCAPCVATPRKSSPSLCVLCRRNSKRAAVYSSRHRTVGYLRQTFLLVPSPSRSTDLFGGAGTTPRRLVWDLPSRVVGCAFISATCSQSAPAGHAPSSLSLSDTTDSQETVRRMLKGGLSGSSLMHAFDSTLCLGQGFVVRQGWRRRRRSVPARDPILPRGLRLHGLRGVFDLWPAGRVTPQGQPIDRAELEGAAGSRRSAPKFVALGRERKQRPRLWCLLLSDLLCCCRSRWRVTSGFPAREASRAPPTAAPATRRFRKSCCRTQPKRCCWTDRRPQASGVPGSGCQRRMSRRPGRWAGCVWSRGSRGSGGRCSHSRARKSVVYKRRGLVCECMSCVYEDCCTPCPSLKQCR